MGLVHGVEALPEGGVRITLTDREQAALARLPDELLPLVRGEAEGPTAEAVYARLFPAAYDDEELEREYRELADPELLAERSAAFEAFRETLAQGRRHRGRWVLQLSDDDAHTWLSVVNDARLVLGAVVGITSEEQWEAGPDEADPASVLLWYLGWLEEELVQALAGSLPEP